MRIVFRYIVQLWAVAWLAVVIGGCSEEGVSGAVESESGDKQIGFTIQSTTMSSKATVIADVDDLQKEGFKVGAYIANSTTQYIPYSQLEYDEVNFVWQYTDGYNRYWPSNTSTHLSFIAYYPDVSVTTVDGTSFAFNYTVASSPDDQYDLIYAFREDVECPEVAPYSVKIPLYHALTQVVFKAESSLGVDVEVAELEIHNLKNSGTFTVSDDTSTYGNSGVWALNDAISDFSAVIAPEGVTVPSNGSTVQLTDGDNVMILMPQEFSPWEPGSSTIAENNGDSGAKGAYLKILCDLDSDYIYVPISSQNSDDEELWDAGCIVTYTLTFGKGYDDEGNSNNDVSDLVDVAVKATLKGWINGGDYSVEF